MLVAKSSSVTALDMPPVQRLMAKLIQAGQVLMPDQN